MEIDANTLHAMEERLFNKGFSINLEDKDNVRFCVAHIILKAISLTKNPKIDKSRVKDLFDTASELLALIDVNTDSDNKRLRDLIDAMIDGDDVSIAMRKVCSEIKASLAAFETRIKYDMDIVKESQNALSESVSDIRSNMDSKTSKTSALKTGLIVLVMISSVLIAIITGSVILAAHLSKISQPLDVQKSSYTGKPPINAKQSIYLKEGVVQLK